jgi:hypothetical protein
VGKSFKLRIEKSVESIGNFEKQGMEASLPLVFYIHHSFADLYRQMGRILAEDPRRRYQSDDALAVSSFVCICFVEADL